MDASEDGVEDEIGVLSSPRNEDGQQVEETLKRELSPDEVEEEGEDDDDATPPPTERPPQVKRRKFFAKDSDSDNDVPDVSIAVKPEVPTASFKVDKGKGRAIDQSEVFEILDDTDSEDDAPAAGPSKRPSNAKLQARSHVARDGKDFQGEKYFGTIKIKGYATVSSKNTAKDVFKQSRAVKIERPVVSAITQKKLANASVSAREKAEDSIVRLRNSQDREIGRIIHKEAGWMAKSIDLGLARFEGTVLDPPKELSSGLTEFTLSIRTFVKRDAFVSHEVAAKKTAKAAEGNASVQKAKADAKKAKANGKAAFIVNEAVDTEMEYLLRRRKAAIKHLLKKLKMKPVLRGEAVDRIRKKAEVIEFYKDRNGSKKQKDKPSTSSSSSKLNGIKDTAAVKTEAKEENEEEGSELAKDQVEGVLAKASRVHRDLPEMDPPPHFSLQLRSYQKQALKWMCDKERGVEEDDDNIIHPLWAEFVFPPSDNVIDLDEEEEPFFYNEFSGELSLSFPRGGSSVPGGILADEMGLGKTIMIAALIHTNYLSASSQVSEGSSSAEEHNSSDSGGDVSDASEIVESKTTQSRRPKGKQSTLTKSGAAAPLKSKRLSNREGATLVVAPTSLLTQWKDELRRTSKDRLSVLVYNDQKDISHLADELDGGVDVVIVSYGKMGIEYEKLSKEKEGTSRRAKDGLYSVNWYRIILDEAHNIKSRSTRAAKACYALEGRRRWCLSGTPIVNRLEDLFSLLHFLRAEPYGTWPFFKEFVTIPFQNKDSSAGSIVLEIMRSLLLRREKSMKDKHGNPIVPLPGKTFIVHELALAKDERAIYDLVKRDATARYETFVESGTVKNNTIAILALITRLRQACLHPSLLLKAGSSESGSSDVMRKMVAKWLAQGRRKATPEAILAEAEKSDEALQLQCMICGDICEDTVFLPCEHGACKQCILSYISEEHDGSATCPACDDGKTYGVEDLYQAVRTKAASPAAKQEVIDLSDESDSDTSSYKPPANRKPLFRNRSRSSSSSSSMSSGSAKPSRSQSATSEDLPRTSDITAKNWLQKTDFVSSTKIEALIEQLLQAKEEEPKFHAVVFSQFTTFLDLIEEGMKAAKLRSVRLDGSMSRKEREASVRQFHDKSKHCVFVISLKAGGTGLNLTIANRIFLLDYWWNRAIEDQAIDRVHRFGQEREVFVHRFLIKQSIEGKMQKLQEKKTQVIDASLDTDNDNMTMQEQFAAIFEDDFIFSITD